VPDQPSAAAPEPGAGRDPVDQHADPALMVSFTEGADVLFSRDTHVTVVTVEAEHMSADEIVAIIESTSGSEPDGDTDGEHADAGTGSGSGPQ
jgi:hypothetical protein